MGARIRQMALMVQDQDAARAFYTGKLGFEPRMDTPMGESARWVTVGLPGDEVEVVFELAEWMDGDAAELASRRQLIGRGSVMLTVDDCQTIYERWRANGVVFDAPPTAVPYGIQALARDVDGNMLVVVQPPQD